MQFTFGFHAVSRQVLVFVMLLSFLGQAFASPSVCINTERDTANGASVSSERNVVMQSPCHQMMSSLEANVDRAMNCCDQDAMAIDHSCSCPDGSCAGSLSFISYLPISSLFITETSAIFELQRFTSQIDSALFRPPIV